MGRILKEGESLPTPAEDLSADDDLLSWILVDQLGCLPGSRLEVHPQQVKFVGPPFKTSEVLKIVSETVVNLNKAEARRRLLEFPLIKAHLETKVTEKQRVRFINHLMRYTLLYRPASRLEISSTDRYAHISGHSELAVYATCPLAIGDVVRELQGSIVPLPNQWRDEMDMGEEYEEYAMEAAGDENSEEESEFDEEGEDEVVRDGTATSSAQNDEAPKKGKRKKEPKGARRSNRTKRRDFSIVWSEKDKCYQLFLGPARFLNHDCNPNVALLRDGSYVTFRVERPVKIGDEITTHYGPNYFGQDNIECLCLTCEKLGKGGFTKAPGTEEAASPSRSASVSTPSKYDCPAPSRKPVKPSALRNALGALNVNSEEEDEEEAPIAGPSGTSHADSEPITPRKPKPKPDLFDTGGVDSPATDGTGSEPDSHLDSGPPKRERYQRKAAKNAQHFSFLRRPKKAMDIEEPQLVMDKEDEGYQRCVTCCQVLRNRPSLLNRYFDHCLRCIRHSLIFDLPWPFHRRGDVVDYPPSHLIPRGYIPPRISSIPLPSLDRNKKKHSEPAPVAPRAENAMERRIRQFMDFLILDDLQREQLVEEAWTSQVTSENQIRAAEQAKIDAREKRLEAKRLRDENKFKGSGIWSRWQYIDDEEHERIQAAKNAVTTGTRRGGRFKALTDEEEEKKLAEEIEARRREEASALQTDSDADDEDEAEDEDEDVAMEVDEAEQDVQDELDEEMEDVKPVVSPTKKGKNVSKSNPDGLPGVLNPNNVIDMCFLSDSDIVYTAEEESRRRKQKTKKRPARINKDPDESDNSDIREVTAQEAARLMASAPKVLSSPIRRKAKTKPSGKAKRANHIEGGAQSIDATIDEARLDPDGTSRGRGRPRGSGRRQKAAAARLSGLAEAGPSGTSKHRSSPQKTPESEEHIQDRIEKELERLNEESNVYEIMLEGLDEDEKLAWKTTDVFRSNPAAAENAILEHVVKEKMEYRASLAHSHNDHLGKPKLPPRSGRTLPGNQCLLSSADVRAWGSPRSGYSESMTQYDISEITIPTLPRGTSQHEVVGVVYDPGKMDYGRPSTFDGRWSNGDLRMAVTVESARDTFSKEIERMVGWNDIPKATTPEIVQPVIKFIKDPAIDVRATQSPSGSAIHRLNGGPSRSSSTPSRNDRPSDGALSNGTPRDQNANTAVNGSSSQISTSPWKFANRKGNASPTTLIPIAPKRTASPLGNGSSSSKGSSTAAFILSASRAAGAPPKTARRLSNAAPTDVNPWTLALNDKTGAIGSTSRLSAISSRTWPSSGFSNVATNGTHKSNGSAAGNGHASPSASSPKGTTRPVPATVNSNSITDVHVSSSTSSPSGAIRPVPVTIKSSSIANGHASSSISSPKGTTRPVVSSPPRPKEHTINGFTSRSSTTPSQSGIRPNGKTVTPQKQTANDLKSHSSSTPSRSAVRSNGATPIKSTSATLVGAASKVGTPKKSTPSVTVVESVPMNQDGKVSGDVSEDTGFSTGTSLAEEEVEDVLFGSRKRKASPHESVRPFLTPHSRKKAEHKPRRTKSLYD